jgi:RimJ/RimL family protein N-acetyltransferase
MTGLDAPMQGDGCTAEPMTEAYREPLRAACAEDPEIFQLWMLDFGPAGFDSSFDRIAQLPWHRFVLFEGDELAGMSSFINPDLARGVVEIGNTFYRPKFRGTGFNRRVKDMMIGGAFDAGFRRVELRVDRRNQRSQAACRKLGAVQEGIMRADRITWTGHVRDTVLFAILKDEWPV